MHITSCELMRGCLSITPSLFAALFTLCPISADHVQRIVRFAE
jgi:hypothetical protein